ncbi:hypothetical protein FQN54_007327 [Arachnomyces sp. PD_36]|nr:hypothetical protein FQN54_007327 [Arachnomyces sp. PD_36]
MARQEAVKAVKAASNVFPISKKYTVQSTGFWERVRRVFSIDPNRSNGVPLNPQFRNPPPGSLPPQSYDDPVSMPAGDIADNPYWKRDVRRNYPRLSVLKQGDVVGLLTVGNQTAPKDGVLQAGESGAKQLVEVREAGEEHGLVSMFKESRGSQQGVLGPEGLPPLPCNLNSATKYQISSGQGYPEK